jgi:surface antigen
VYAGNRYAYGHCTWHVANLRAAAGKPVPSFWGNGGQWGNNARKDGYTVSSEPQVGSIGVHVGGYGHVAYVTSVSGNMVHVKEMHGFRANGVPMETDYPVSFFNGGFIY